MIKIGAGTISKHNRYKRLKNNGYCVRCGRKKEKGVKITVCLECQKKINQMRER